MYKVRLKFTQYSDHFAVCSWCTDNIGNQSYISRNLDEVYNWKYIDHLEYFEYYFYNVEDYVSFMLIWK
jgi:hypothetical protein